jgi:hypothetical protein
MDKLEFVFNFSGNICVLIFCECWRFLKLVVESCRFLNTVICPILLKNSYIYFYKGNDNVC